METATSDGATAYERGKKYKCALLDDSGHRAAQIGSSSY